MHKDEKMSKNSITIFQAFIKLTLAHQKAFETVWEIRNQKKEIQCLDIDNNINTISRPALSLSDGGTESLGTSQHGKAHQELDTSQKTHQDLHDGQSWAELSEQGCLQVSNTFHLAIPHK